MSPLARCGIRGYGIEALAIRSLLVKRGRIRRLAIDEPKVGRLRVAQAARQTARRRNSMAEVAQGRFTAKIGEPFVACVTGTRLPSRK